MKKINIEKLKKFWSIIDRLERHIGIDGKGNQGRCEKEVFFHRYFRFLSGKCFKLFINDEITYALFTRSTVSSVGNKYNYKYSHDGVTYNMGYSLRKWNIDFRNEKMKPVDLNGLHFNDMLKIEYEEITQEEYFKIVKLFCKS